MRLATGQNPSVLGPTSHPALPIVYHVPCKGLFELMPNVQVNIHGHVGTLSPFYGTFTQN